MAQKTSSELIQMFTERKNLEVKEVNSIRFVEFWLSVKQADWLTNVRLAELGYPRFSNRGHNRDYIGSHNWAMDRAFNKAGIVRMTVDENDVKTILSPVAHIVR